jgi:hypothetical protein
MPDQHKQTPAPATTLGPIVTPRQSQPRPAFESPSFKYDAEKLSVHNGVAYYVTTCYELVDSRWEPFVSMRRAFGVTLPQGGR